MLLEFLLSILANLVTAALIAAVAFGLARRRRARARRFFGIKDVGRLRIHLSSITVVRARTSSALEVASGFRGGAIAEKEYKGAVELSSVVISRSSSVLARAFLGDAANVERITAAIEISPLVDERDDGTLDWSEVEDLLSEGSCAVLVGGPIYNSVTRYVLSGRGKNSGDRDTHLDFVRRDNKDGSFARGISLRHGSQEHGIDEWVGGGRDYYMVEKITRKGTTIFICAGVTAAATAAAVKEVVRWHSLADAYPDEDFARVFVLGEGRTVSRLLASVP